MSQLNRQFKGRTEASNRASTLAAVERGAEPVGLSKELIESIRPSKTNFIASLIRNVLDRKPSVKSLTKGISKS